MYPFIVVQDGAYGISFDIVMADSPLDAQIISRGEHKVSLDWFTAIDLRDFADKRNMVVYTEQPTGG